MSKKPEVVRQRILQRTLVCQNDQKLAANNKKWPSFQIKAAFLAAC